MKAAFFYIGFAIGFGISTPIGAVGVICIRRLFTEGRLSSFVSGFGAAVADSIYAAMAAFGLTFISEFLFEHNLSIRLGAGMFLLFMGVRTFLAVPRQAPEPLKFKGLVGKFVSVFLLALSNPLVIVSLAAIFAALDLSLQQGGAAAMGLLVGGICAGSSLWWVLMVIAVTIFKLRFEIRVLRLINRVAGVIITAFGSTIIISLIWRPF